VPGNVIRVCECRNMSVCEIYVRVSECNVSVQQCHARLFESHMRL